MNNSTYKIISVLSALYLVLISVYLLWHRAWFSPDQFFIVALVGLLLIGRSKQFLRDWLAPVALFLAYESLRSLIPNLIGQAHVFPMIRFDRMIFGTIPAVSLQNWLYLPGVIHWYDYLAVILYETHFVAFLLVGFVFWLIHKKTFSEYFLAILILSYMAFATFVIFPAMPPWMASQKGFIGPIIDIGSQVSSGFPKAVSLPTIYQLFGANLVAAVPSVHAAYSWLIFLFLLRQARLWGLLALFYVFGVWFSLVYLGEHYAFDILMGLLYATTAFLFVLKKDWVVQTAKTWLRR